MKNISRHIIIFIVGILSLITTSSAQKVGLVLSGGGAKGLYHVGVIKALEENGIPIDYISGASMGAIVGGLYAMGYSPDDMIKFFESDSVMDWINGEIPTEYKYYFKKDGTTPDMVTISINNNKTTTKGSKSGFQLPTSILSPYLLDMAFTEMMQGASWAANENFDSLMVPFRCVASDSYNKKLITFRDGSLAFAVRSSMSIPFIFKPLKYDSVLLYDGGIINNFPWQCLKDDFNPDILIGCVCSGNGDNPKEDDLMGQITTLITSPTDYSFSEADSIKGSTIIKRRFYEVSTLEYNKAHYIIEKGYNDAIEKMPELLQHISRRVDSTEISSKRTAFRRKIKPLIFDDVIIDGVTPAQKSYILHQLGYLTPGKDYDMSYFKQKYFRLIGAGIFEGKFPTITYNPETERYQLHLTFSTKPSMQFSFGGNISSTSLNQVYMGFMYSHVNRIASSYFIGGLLGTYYNSVAIGGRHDIYTNFPFFIQYHYAWEQYDFTCNNMSRYHKDQIFRLNQAVNNSLNLTLGASAFTNYVFKLSWAGILSEYKYYPGTHISTETEDRTKFLYSKLTTSLEKNSLNYTLYPSLGTQFDIGLSYYAGIETYSKGTSIFSQLFEGEEFEGQNRSWVELRSKVESYHFINNWFNLGFLGDLKISNAPSFGTDIADYFIRTQFSPTPHASSMFMKEFRSASHIALGLVPIFKFTNNQKFYLKAYAYCYVPQEVIYEDNSWQPFSTKRFKEYVQGIFGGSLVYQTPLGPASLSYNNYTTGPNNWSLMVNFGFALFKTSN